MKNKKEKWIVVGYEIFALNGPSGLWIEHLADRLDISKSSFYHFFADLDCFIEELLEYHIKRVEIIADEEKKCSSIEPELINVLATYKLDLLFSRQLRLLRADALYKQFFDKTNRNISDSIIELWSREIGLDNNKSIAQDVYDLVVENFYMQISIETLNFQWLSDFFRNVEFIVKSIKNSSNK